MVNPLHDPTEALQFALAFAQTNLPPLPKAKRNALGRQLHAFIERENPGMWKHARPFDDATLGELQRQILDFFTRFVDSRGLYGRADGRFALTGKLVLEYWGREVDGSFRVWVDGDDEHRLIYQAFRVIEQCAPKRILRCPECGTLFLKVTRKEYCSARCQMRVYMRARRAGERRAKEPSR